jgi:hypothetical protein
MKKGLAIILFLLIVIFIGIGVLVKLNSNDVLDAFETMDAKIEEANKATESRNDSFLRSLQNKDFQSSLVLVKQLDTLSATFTTYLEGLKKEMLGTISEGDFEAMDQSARVDTLFFEGNSLSEKGKEFKMKMNDFRMSASQIVSQESPELAEELMKMFNTDLVNNQHGAGREWLNYNFKGFPLIVSLTRITQILSDVANTKQQYLEILLTSKE